MITTTIFKLDGTQYLYRSRPSKKNIELYLNGTNRSYRISYIGSKYWDFINSIGTQTSKGFLDNINARIILSCTEDIPLREITVCTFKY